MPEVIEKVNDADNGGNMSFGAITYTQRREITFIL